MTLTDLTRASIGSQRCKPADAILISMLPFGMHIRLLELIREASATLGNSRASLCNTRFSNEALNKQDMPEMRDILLVRSSGQQNTRKAPQLRNNNRAVVPLSAPREKGRSVFLH